MNVQKILFRSDKNRNDFPKDTYKKYLAEISEVFKSIKTIFNENIFYDENEIKLINETKFFSIKQNLIIFQSQ